MITDREEPPATSRVRVGRRYTGATHTSSPPPLHAALGGQRLGEVACDEGAGRRGKRRDPESRVAGRRTPHRRGFSALGRFEPGRNVRLVYYLSCPPRPRSSGTPPKRLSPKAAPDGRRQCRLLRHSPLCSTGSGSRAVTHPQSHSRLASAVRRTRHRRTNERPLEDFS